MTNFDIVPSNDSQSISSADITISSSLYETATLFSLRNETLGENPYINSLVDKNTLYLAVDQHLSIVSDLEKRTVSFEHQFSYNIEVFALVKDLLLLGLCNGEVHLLNVSLFKFVGSCCISKNVWFDSKFFIGIYKDIDVSDDFLVLTKKGQLFRISYDNVRNLSSDMVTDLANNVTTAACSNGHLVAAGNNLIVYDLILNITDEISLDKEQQLKEVWACHYTTFIGLRGDGVLCKICPFTLCFMEMDTYDYISDFLMYMHSKNTYMYYVSIVDSQQRITMVEFDNDKEESFSLSTTTPPYLVYMNDDDENQLYLTKEGNNLHLNVIRETKPEDRFKRLILKMHFDEAEAFAKKYNLSPIEINKAKVSTYLEKLCSIDDIDDLLALLREIPDVQYQFQVCRDVSAYCACMGGVEKIVKFMSGFKYQDISPPFDFLLNLMIFNYDTYQTVCRCENEEMSVNGYQDFNKNDLFDYLITLLRRGKLESAIIVCSRLGSTDFTHQNIATVLKYADSYHLRDIASFLHTLIPNTLLVFPEARNTFCKMVIRKVYASERRCDEINFPEVCISFVDQTLNILSGDYDNEVFDSNLTKELVDILKSLKTILELKNNFNLLLPLSVCLEGPGAMLRTLLGKNFAFEDDFLDKFLVKFMIENNLCPDTVLSKEITALLRCSPNYWIPLIPRIWKSVTSTSIRLQLLLQMLHAAPKPWCNEIRDMLCEALEWNHPLVADILAEAKNEPKYVVLYRREYGLEDETLESAETDTYVIQRMIHCHLPTLMEDVYTLYTSEESRLDAHFLLMLHYINAYELKNVFSLINRFNVDERKKLVRDLCMFYRNNSTLKDVKLRRCLIQSLEILVKNFPDSNIENLIDVYKIIDHLPSDMLNLDLFTKLQTKTGREAVKQAVIGELCLNTDDFQQFLKKCKTYGQVFHLPYERVAFQVCSLTHDMNLMHRCASYLYEHSEDPESLSLMSILILRDISMGDNDTYGMFFNDTIQTDSSGKPIDEKMLTDCLALGRHMIAKASLLSGNDLNERNVFVWIGNTSDLAQSDNQSSMYTMYQISNVFNRFSHYIQKSAKSSDGHYLTYSFPARLNESEDDDEDLIMKDGSFNTILRSLEQALPSILRENQYWTVLKLLLTLPGQFELAGEDLLNQRLQRMIGKVKGNYLSQIFAAQTIKERDAFSLLLSYPQKKALKIITEAMQRYKLNFGKFEAIVKLGKRLTAFYRSGDPFSKTMLGIKWRKRLPDCSLSLNNFFMSLSKDELLDPLIVQNQLSIEQVAEFSIDFKLDAQSNYLKYLKHMMNTWTPTYEVKVDICGNHTLDVKDSEVDLTTKCMSVVALINNRDAVLKCIDTLWKTTNVYYYEVFMAILSIAASLNDVRHINFRMVLHFFRNYQRVSKPSEIESEEWCSRFMYKTLDPISEWRFPFSPMLFTNDLWKILRSEIKLSNYEKWFVLTDLLKYFTRNDICSFVVKDMSFNYPKAAGDCEEKYNLHPMFKQAFADIDKCLAYITEPLLAASMSFHLIAKSPNGADRVTASKLAYKYAKICKNAGIDVATYNQIETAYYTYATIHILHNYKLTRPDYLALVDSPNELIETLYKDERIVMQSNISHTQCPDINKATDELAALFQLDVCAIRIELLNAWLIDQNALISNINQSICLMPDVNEAFDENFECVRRAAYVCTQEDSEFWRNHIFNLFQNTDENYPQVQGRLLKTMSLITSPEVLEELWECPYSDILKSIEQFFLIHDLRPMGVPIKVEHLGAIDHKKLLYKLGKKLTNPKAVKAMITVCDLYQEYDLNVCEKILQGLINLNMIAELKKCIAKFKKLNVLICSNVYVKAWQTVIDNTFSNLEADAENFDQELHGLLHFLQSSPVLNHLKLTAGVQICWKFKKYPFVMLLLQYEPITIRNQYLRELLHKSSKEYLLSSLESLRGKGFIGFEIVSQAIKNGLWVLN